MNSKLRITNYELRIGWLYPELMSTYGDYGNIIVLQRRCEWRGINVDVVHLSLSKWEKDIDLLFMGGAQDKEQEIVSEDLVQSSKLKVKSLTKMIEDGIPGLYICGAYQFLGQYYKAADETTIPGLGIFDMYTVNPGKHEKRLIGDIIVDVSNSTFSEFGYTQLVGFENHGGRTYLGKSATPFAHVVKGFGNNGEDGTEGILYKNSIGSYLHGPLLPKNPEIADWFIAKALEHKYNDEITLQALDDSWEQQAKKAVLSTYE
ncbi:cobalamin biosynthesis protein CobQ [Candidatus Roizmanbacteria bacterium]|nr:cobalamin biosynthesis protein CobQ [Candidatus Roizmanbacteria bacterium]